MSAWSEERAAEIINGWAAVRPHESWPIKIGRSELWALLVNLGDEALVTGKQEGKEIAARIAEKKIDSHTSAFIFGGLAKEIRESED